MSKATFILITLISIPIGILNAQTLSVGPMIGVNSSKFSGASNKKSIAGLRLGAFANYSVNEHIGIGAKLLYSQLGTGFKIGDNINRLHYLQMPITGIYYFGEEGNQFRPKIFAGPYVGTLLDATYKDGKKITEANSGTVFNKLDVGGVLGLGFNYRIRSRTWLNVDLSFSQGFTEVNKKPLVSDKNQAISLSVGVSFPVGKD